MLDGKRDILGCKYVCIRESLVRDAKRITGKYSIESPVHSHDEASVAREMRSGIGKGKKQEKDMPYTRTNDRSHHCTRAVLSAQLLRPGHILRRNRPSLPLHQNRVLPIGLTLRRNVVPPL